LNQFFSAEFSGARLISPKSTVKRKLFRLV
jgi:hypothetical protein